MNEEEFRRFRKELSNIGHMKSRDDAELVESTKAALVELKKIYPNKTVDIVYEDTKPLAEFNCFEYALGLHESKEYMPKRKTISEKGLGIACNSCFVQWLVKKEYLKEPNNEEGNKIILYYESLGLRELELKHAGVIEKNKIISKWGQGCIYKHEIFDIPKEYGTRRAIYKKPDKPEVEKFFNKYLQEIVETISKL